MAARAAPGLGATRGSGRRGSSSASAAARSSTAPSASARCSASCAPRISTRRSTSPTAPPFGLTSGLHSLDDREVARWLDADRGRQPLRQPPHHRRDRPPPALRRLEALGGRAGGQGRRAELRAPASPLAPDRPAEAGEAKARCATSTLLAHCLALADDADEQALLRASAASYAQAWRTHFSREHDPSQLLGEQNVFRYRPCRLVLVRGDADGPGRPPVALPDPARRAHLRRTADREPAAVGNRLGLAGGAGPTGRIRDRSDPDRAPPERRGRRAPARLAAALDRPASAANRGHVAVIDAPVLANGRLELRWYLREQALSRVVHRYGNLIASPIPPVDTPGGSA